MNKEFVIVSKDGTVLETDSVEEATKLLQSITDTILCLRKIDDEYIIVFALKINLSMLW